MAITYDQPGGVTYDQPLFTYDQTGASPFPVPPAPASPLGTDGWAFAAQSPAGVITPIHPSLTGTLTHDLSREIRRTADGLMLTPDQAARIDLAADLVWIYLRVDGIAHPMGLFHVSEDSVTEDAFLDEHGDPADLNYLTLGDRLTRLRACDEVARTALAGADPSQVMIAVIATTGVPASIAGAANPISTDVVWPAGTTAEAIVSQCADLAGHRRPWADNTGVIRSVAAQVVSTEVIPLAELGPLAGSVTVTNTRLFTPNRIVVVDDTALVPTVGTWDAPASAPNSAVARGWVQTQIVTQQGLSGSVHAAQVAATVGEQLAARGLSATIRPTWRLDGPVILSHRGAYWMVTSWSVAFAPGATMSLTATEVFADYPAPPDALWGAGGGPAPTPPPPVPSAYDLAVLADSPLIYLKLDEATGVLPQDSSGNNRDASYAQGVIGAAVHLGSSASRSVDSTLGTLYPFDVAGYGAFGTTGGVSVEVWIKSTATFATVNTYETTDTPLLTILLSATTGASIVIAFGGLNFAEVLLPDALLDGSAVHVVATFDNTTLTAYVNGAPVGSAAVPSSDSLDADETYGLISGGGALWDSYALYPTELSAARVAAHYTAGTTP